MTQVSVVITTYNRSYLLPLLTHDFETLGLPATWTMVFL
jgi:hypothetical protein